MPLLANATCVSVDGRGVVVQGPPGSGKSSLALALIDRGAILVGDDGVALQRVGDRLIARPPPRIAGKLEIRGVGIVDLPAQAAPVALILTLGRDADRLPDADTVTIQGVTVPHLPFRMIDGTAAIRAEWALRLHGLPKPATAM